MASMHSRSPARSGFTCAQTNPVESRPPWYCGSSFSAVLVTAMRINASAFASGGSFCDRTSSMAGAHSSRSLFSATLPRNGLVVTPTAPRARPRSSSAASAESCHHLVAVFSITHWRYVFCILSSRSLWGSLSGCGRLFNQPLGVWFRARTPIVDRGTPRVARRIPSCPTFQFSVTLYLDDAPQHSVPGRAIGPEAHGGCFFVADHRVLLRIPMNGPAEPHGHVRQVARHGHAMPVLYFAQGPLTRADAVYPVALVHGHGVFAAGAVPGIGGHAAFGRLNPGLGLDVGVDRSADGMAHEPRDIVDGIDFHLRDHFISAAQDQVALGALIQLSARRRIAPHGVGLADGHRHGETGERPHRVLRIGRLAVVLEREAPAAALHQGWPLDVHDPQDLVDHVSAQIRHLSARVIPEPAEMVQAAMRLERLLRRRTLPHIVVEIGGRVLHLRLAESRIDVAVGRHPDGMHFAERSAVDHLLGFADALAMAPLRAHHDDAVVFARRLYYPLAFVVEHRHRLLDVNVLACGAGHGGEHRVPVVGGGDHRRLDVLVVQHLAEVAEALGPRVSHILKAFLQAGLVDVAYAG